jgi:hypothetical protein
MTLILITFLFLTSSTCLGSECDWGGWYAVPVLWSTGPVTTYAGPVTSYTYPVPISTYRYRTVYYRYQLLFVYGSTC